MHHWMVHTNHAEASSLWYDAYCSPPLLTFVKYDGAVGKLGNI